MQFGKDKTKALHPPFIIGLFWYMFWDFKDIDLIV
jgi:hypothetical protein